LKADWAQKWICIKRSQTNAHQRTCIRRTLASLEAVISKRATLGSRRRICQEEGIRRQTNAQTDGSHQTKVRTERATPGSRDIQRPEQSEPGESGWSPPRKKTGVHGTKGETKVRAGKLFTSQCAAVRGWLSRVRIQSPPVDRHVSALPAWVSQMSFSSGSYHHPHHPHFLPR
jgi:hypothetical protein